MRHRRRRHHGYIFLSADFWGRPEILASGLWGGAILIQLVGWSTKCDRPGLVTDLETSPRILSAWLGSHGLTEDLAREAMSLSMEAGLYRERVGGGLEIRGRGRIWNLNPTGNSSAVRVVREREARKLGDHSRNEWRRMVAACGFACVRCGASEVRLTKDHVVPISRGGSNAIENIQPLCKACNCSKGVSAEDYRPSDWLPRFSVLGGRA